MYKYLPYFTVITLGLSSCAHSQEDVPDCPEGQIYDVDLEQCVESLEEEIQLEEGLKE